MKRLLPLLTACFLPTTHAEEAVADEPLEFIRVTEDGDDTRLETAVTRFEKDGVSVELIGAIHVADAKYYTALGKRFENYDALLYEGIGNAFPKRLQVETVEEIEILGEGELEVEKPESLEGLAGIYQKAANWLDLR